jgi:hypothetical protein
MLLSNLLNLLTTTVDTQDTKTLLKANTAKSCAKGLADTKDHFP